MVSMITEMKLQCLKMNPDPINTRNEQYEYNIIYKRSVYRLFSSEKKPSLVYILFHAFVPAPILNSVQMELQVFTVLSIINVMEVFKIICK
jgi:hypothetical protein